MRLLYKFRRDPTPLGCPAGRKNGLAYACAAGSVVEPRVSLILSQAFHEEGEFS